MKRLAALVLLTACSTGGLSPSQPSRVGAQFVPDAAGLAIAGSALRIDFGRSPAGVIPVIERELGSGRSLGAAGCPTGIATQMAWDDLVLTFSPERFVGWRTASGGAGQVCAATS